MKLAINITDDRYEFVLIGIEGYLSLFEFAFELLQIYKRSFFYLRYEPMKRFHLELFWIRIYNNY